MQHNAPSPNERRPDAEASSISTSSNRCHGCSTTLKDYVTFRCSTCEQQLRSGGSDSFKHLYCNMCIVVLHKRQAHEIADRNGTEPETCKAHLNVCIFFCNNCKVIFCPDCIAAHLKHTFDYVNKKAEDTQSKIKANLEVFENLLIKMGQKRLLREESEKRIRTLLQYLSPENITDTLVKICEQAIRSQNAKWQELASQNFMDSKTESANNEKSGKRFQEVLDKSETCVETLRALLKVSESSCVKEFLREEKNLTRSINNQNEQFARFLHLEWTNELESNVICELEKLVRSIKIPSVVHSKFDKLTFSECETKVEPLEIVDIEEPATYRNKTLANWYSYDIMELSIESEEVKFSIPSIVDWDYQACSNPPVLHLQKLTFTIRDVIKVFRSKRFVVFISRSNTVRIYCLDRRQCVKKFTLDAKLVLLGLVPPSEHETDKRMDILVFNSSCKRIELLYDTASPDNSSMECESEPRNFQNNGFSCVYIDYENVIYIADFQSKVKFKVDWLHHGFGRIDKLCLAFNDLFIMDQKNGIILKTSFTCDSNKQKWKIEKVLKLNKLVDNPMIVGIQSEKMIVCGFEGNSLNVAAIDGSVKSKTTNSEWYTRGILTVRKS